MSIKIEGLEDFQKQIEQMQKNSKELHGFHNVPLTKLFTPAFMRNYTKFSSFSALLDAGGFHIKNPADFNSIPQKKLDAHIAKTTKFKTWDEMLEKATALYVSKKLGF